MGFEQRINRNASGYKIKHPWSTCIGAGRAKEGLQKAWLEQLKMTVEDCGFEYIRFHGLLCDDMGIYHHIDSIEHYCFIYIDQLFDELLKIGIRPFVEFGFMPEDMASGDNLQFWWKGNVSIPKDYNAWARLLKALVNHWIERYGHLEVESWYFELWNEPNLHAFWSGTKNQYFELYKISVNAIKEIDQKLRVGGPATSNFVPDGRFDGEKEDFTKHKTNSVKDLSALTWKGVWIEAFLTYCEQEGLAVDFISTHPYPTDFALDSQDKPAWAQGQPEMKGRSRNLGSTVEDIKWLNTILKKSCYSNIEIQLTEWSSSPTSRDYSHDYLPAACYIVKTNIDCIGLTDSLSYWVFSDIFEEAGPGPELLHGGFGLLNMQGIKKPSYHAYRMLHSLGHEVLEKTDYSIMTKNENGRLRGLIYYYPDELKEAVPIAAYPDYKRAEEIQSIGERKTVRIVIEGLPAKTQIDLEVLDTQSGCVASLWRAMDYPQNCTREQIRQLADYAEQLRVESLVPDLTGSVTIELEMQPFSIILIKEVCKEIL